MADGFQIARHVGLETGHRNWLVMEHLQDGSQRRLARERRPARQKFVEDRAEGIDIRRRADRLARDHRLFWRHVIGRAQQFSCDGGPRRIQRVRISAGALGQAEIRNLGNE